MLLPSTDIEPGQRRIHRNRKQGEPVDPGRRFAMPKPADHLLHLVFRSLDQNFNFTVTKIADISFEPENSAACRLAQ